MDALAGGPPGRSASDERARTPGRTSDAVAGCGRTAHGSSARRAEACGEGIVKTNESPGPRLWRHLRQELKQLDPRLRPRGWYRAYVPEVLRKLVRAVSRSVSWLRERP